MTDHAGGNAIRAGIAGAGLMGLWHADAVKNAGGRVTAIVDNDIKSAEKLAARYNGVRVYTDVQTMLKQKDFEVLHVCTPLTSHYSIAESALEAGVHIIVEKPLSATAAETERLFRLAEENGARICPVHQFVFQEGVTKAKEMLPRIGQIVHMEAVVCSAGRIGQSDEDVDNIVADILPHPLSVIQHFLSNDLPEDYWSAIHPGSGEFRALCDMPGMTLSIFISMNARPTECSFRIVGTAGTIHIDMFHGFAFMEPGNVSRVRKISHPFELAARRFSAAAINLGSRIIRREPAYPGLRKLVSLFYEAVNSKSESPLSRNDTISIARVRDRLTHNAGPVKNMKTPEYKTGNRN
jgi:predicted dehydrogenase